MRKIRSFVLLSLIFCISNISFCSFALEGPDIVWQKVYNRGNDDCGYDVTVDDTGNIYVTGYSNNGTNDDYFTIKYNSKGDVVWQKAYNGGDQDCAYAIITDYFGNVYVTGYSYINGDKDYLTIKYDSNGDTVWQKAYNSGREDGALGIDVDDTGNVYVTGFIHNSTRQLSAQRVRN